jgi:hypothetical protein
VVGAGVITAIRDALEQLLAPLGDVLVVPAKNEYDSPRGFHKLRFTVRIMAHTERLDEMLAPEGERSVRQVVKQGRRLGGLVGDAKVVQSSGYLDFVAGGEPRLGAEWTVETLVEGGA